VTDGVNLAGQLAKQVRRGVAVSAGADVLRQAVEIGGGILMARLLRPEDFGVVAVAMSFLQLSNVVGNLGMATAIVQSASMSRAAINYAFTVSTLAALALTVAGIVLAPMAASFFRIDALTTAMPIMSVQVLLAGMVAIPIGLLRRRMRFGTIAIIDGSSAVVYATTGIGLALSGAGYWSLVWAPVVAGAWTLVVAFATCNERPRFGLSTKETRSILRFGGGLTVKNVLVFLSRNMDNLIVTRMLGATAAGFYTRAFNLTRVPQMRIVGIVYQVSFPAFCRLRDDRTRFHDLFDTASRLTALSVVPILLGVAAVADDFTLALLGPQWEGMIVPLRFLAIAALINCLHALAGAAIEATGKVGYEVVTQAIYAALVIGGTIAGARWGVEGVSYAVACGAVVFFLLKAVTIRLAAGISTTRFVTPALGPLAAGAVMYAAVHFMLAAGAGPLPALAPEHHWTRLFVGTATGIVAYSAAIAVLAPAHLRLLVSQVSQFRQETRANIAKRAATESQRALPR